MTRLRVRVMVESTYWSWPGQLLCGSAWRTADGALTRLSVDERGRKFLLELARAAVV